MIGTGAPAFAKRVGRRAAVAAARPTAALRAVPDVVVVGASRCGTTSLHRALLTHPGLRPPVLHKGVHFFDVHYGRGMGWYRSHFPIRGAAGAQGRVRACFESSGYYMHHPLAPERMLRDLPRARLVVMLRDPVERAYSAFKHEHARGFEPEAQFERALALEDERLDGEIERIRADVTYVSLAHRHQSYVDRGRYDGQVRRLFELFGRDRVHVLFSEDFFTAPEQTYEQLLDFLGLPVVHAPGYERHNARTGSPMPEATRAALTAHYEPHDQALAALLGRVPPWRQ